MSDTAKPKNSLEPDEVAYISQPSGWLHACSLDPLFFYSTQKVWIDGRSNKVFELTKKSRRVGYTFSKSNRAIARAHIKPGSTTIFTSMNLQESHDKIEVCRQTYYNIHPKMRKPLVTDTKTMLEFAHDAKTVSRIICMFKPRGQKGRDIDINIDEFDHIQDQEAVLTAAIPNITHGGRLSIGTSVHGGRRFFDEMWNGAFRDEMSQELVDLLNDAMVKVEIPWWLCPYLLDARWHSKIAYVASEAPKMSTEARVLTFGSTRLKYIYAMSYEEHFLQEYELIPIADGSAVIPWETILGCTPTGENARSPFPSFDQALAFAENVGSRLFLGYDVGRRKNASELSAFVWNQTADKLEEVYYETSKDTPFDDQKKILKAYLGRNKRIILSIDATGMGEDMSESLQRECPRQVIPVQFQNYSKLLMFDLLLARMQRRGIEFCADRMRMDQLFSLKRRVSEAGNVIYYVPRKERHHADKAVSIALASFGLDGEQMSFSTHRVRVGGRRGAGRAERSKELIPQKRAFHDDVSSVTN